MVEERGEEEAIPTQSYYAVERRRRKAGSQKLDRARTSERLVEQLGVPYPPWQRVGLRHHRSDRASQTLLSLLRLHQV